MLSINKITDSEKLNYLDSDFCWSNIKYLDTLDYHILHDECYETYSSLRMGLIYEGSPKRNRMNK